MQTRIPIKNHQQETQLIAKRAMLICLIVSLLVTTVILRLAFLQIYKHHVYTTLSINNWLDLVPNEPTRGLIYDRYGILLAENIPVFSLDIIPDQVDNLSKTICELSKIIVINNNEIVQFRKQRRQHRRFDEIPLKLRLSEEEVVRFAENQHQFPGVIIKARLIRHYPFGASFSHVLGYVGRINAQELNEIDPSNYSASYYIGKLGIEKFYEEELHGQVGYEEVENDASGKPIRILKTITSKPGKNIYLTLDSQLQLVIEKAFAEQNGAVIALQPKTGQLLAMVSKPGYDPNLFVTGMSHQDYQTLQQSQERPLYNRALLGLYPPASTIKPFLAIGGLETGVISENSTINDPGWFQLPNSKHSFHDWWPPGHGTVNVNRAIITSCDTYFYDLAHKLGVRRLNAILSQFGFGTLTGIDLDDEVPGIIASPAWKQQMKNTHWYAGDTVLSGIGQGFTQATPLQLAIATATLANRGQRVTPYLLLGEQTPGQPIAKQSPIPLTPIKLRDRHYWEVVINAMKDVIASREGTAHKLKHHLRYTIAGKTGTAQVVSKRIHVDASGEQKGLPVHLRDHNLFIAFAPADHPVIVLAIIVEHNNTATDTARAILDFYLTRKGKKSLPPLTDSYPHQVVYSLQSSPQLN